MDDKEAFVNYIGPLAAADMKATGVLASVTAAQAILESNYGTSELAAMTHNLFGMKAKLSGNTWPSSWGGPVYTKKTKEQRADGSEYEISATLGPTSPTRPASGTTRTIYYGPWTPVGHATRASLVRETLKLWPRSSKKEAMQPTSGTSTSCSR